MLWGNQRIYISDRRDSTPPAFSKQLPTQPLPALSAVHIIQLPDCLTEQAGGEVGWANAWKTQGVLSVLLLIYILWRQPNRPRGPRKITCLLLFLCFYSMVRSVLCAEKKLFSRPPGQKKSQILTQSKNPLRNLNIRKVRPQETALQKVGFCCVLLYLKYVFSLNFISVRKNHPWCLFIH